MPTPAGFPTGDELIQFLLDEQFITEVVPDSERYDEVMESVAEAFMVDIKREFFIQTAAGTEHTFDFYGGTLFIPPYGMFAVTSVAIDGEVQDSSTYDLRGKNEYGAYLSIRFGRVLSECQITVIGTLGMVVTMPVFVKRALLSRGTADLYDGVEGTKNYVGSGEVKKVTQGPVTIEYDVGTSTVQKARLMNPLKQTYKKAVNKFILRSAF